MKLVIIDRDGVVNEDSDAFIKRPEEWHPVPGSLQAIARLNQAGWRVVIATNQSGVARGLFDLATLGAIHAKMQHAVAAVGGRIDAIFFCPHGPDDDCPCRKPKPGMIREILERFHANAADVFYVGDTLRDLQAAVAAGCRPVLVLSGKGCATLQAGGLPESTQIRVDLAAFAAELAA